MKPTLLLVCLGALAVADSVPVRYAEGRIHGFVVLRDQQDRILASGDLQQVTTAGRVNNELVLRFKDGSTHTETTVFSQQRTFRLLSYHLVQKGPAFPRPMDMVVNASGQVTLRYTDDDGKPKTVNDTLDAKPDLANGLVPTLIADIDPKAPKTVLSMVAPTTKPRLVKLEITPLGEDSFTVGGSGPRKATVYNVKVVIGGVAGVVAPIVGKQPPDTRVWVVGGKAPGFLKSEGPLFDGGPVWRIEMASPVWPKESTRQSGDRDRDNPQASRTAGSPAAGAR